MKKVFMVASVLAVVAIFAAFAGGCAKNIPPSPKDVVQGEFENAPKWVTQGCSAFWGEKKAEKKICGIGTMAGSRNMSLVRSTAMARGRTDIARSLNTSVQSMLKDYQSTTTGGQEFGTAAADEQHVVDVSKQITDMSLSGTELADSWISPNGTLYVLVVLDVEGFKSAIAKMNNLNESVRQAVIQRADKAFDDLDSAVQKQREGK